ncbi:FBP C-terminal treble-clef zinc-finger [Pseudonocardia thermophila]|jgi:Fibronectin-binding protein (FBP).|uniref:FBP C-terminal treble-clef zinc-finger n=1 Tax=Pseudonocardia thermophila TaxID=1848 RepID=A0A1M6PG08_PSETH|nr:FBP domain-containing protein [Pseudonocardia thermophila]SHK06889.1 FBP C-terminal treble-clef zinc-finger [Pseudonocardia thermophila]
MNPLTAAQIRASFVNATRREISQATLPDLDALRWDRLDYLGWRDRKAPLAAYVVVELDGAPTGIVLRAADRGDGAPRRALCTWCEDVIEIADVTLYTARRAGAPGRNGASIGTLVCTDFRCSANVRRRPTSAEAGTGAAEIRELLVAGRVAGLQERCERFVREVASTR